MSKQYLTRLNHLFSPGGLGIKLSPTYGDMPRKNFIHSMATDPKVESAFLKALEAVNGMCPKNENNISNDSPMGDLMHTIKYFSQAGELQRGAVFALANAIQASSTFRGLARAKVISQQMKHRLGLQKKVTFKEPLMIHGGETTIGQGSAYVPSQGGQRRQLEKQGNAKLVSNLSVEQGKGMLEPQNVHPDVLMENQSMPKVTSIREAMTDLSSFQPTATEKYSLNMKEAPGDLKRQQYSQRLHDSFPEKIHAQRGIKRTIPQNSESLSDKKIKGAQMLMENRGTGISEAPVTRSLNITTYPTTGQGTGGKTTMGGTPGVQVIQGQSPMVIENLHNAPNMINSGDNASQIKTIPRLNDYGPGVTPGPPQALQVPNVGKKEEKKNSYEDIGSHEDKKEYEPTDEDELMDFDAEDAAVYNFMPRQYHEEYDILRNMGHTPAQSVYLVRKQNGLEMRPEEKYPAASYRIPGEEKKDRTLIETNTTNKQWWLPLVPIVTGVVSSFVPSAVKAVDSAIEERWPSQGARSGGGQILGPTPVNQAPSPAVNPKNPKPGGGQPLGPGALRTQKTLLQTGGSTQRRKQTLQGVGLTDAFSNLYDTTHPSEVQQELTKVAERSKENSKQYHENQANVNRRQADADRLIQARADAQAYEQEHPDAGLSDEQAPSATGTSLIEMPKKDKKTRPRSNSAETTTTSTTTGAQTRSQTANLKRTDYTQASFFNGALNENKAFEWVYNQIKDGNRFGGGFNVGKYDTKTKTTSYWNKTTQEWDSNIRPSPFTLVTNGNQYNVRVLLPEGTSASNREIFRTDFAHVVQDAIAIRNATGKYNVRSDTIDRLNKTTTTLTSPTPQPLKNKNWITWEEEQAKTKEIIPASPESSGAPKKFRKVGPAQDEENEDEEDEEAPNLVDPNTTTTSTTTTSTSRLPTDTTPEPLIPGDTKEEDGDEGEVKGGIWKPPGAESGKPPKPYQHTGGSSTHLAYPQDPKNNGVANPWEGVNKAADAVAERDDTGAIINDPLGYMRPAGGGMRPMIAVNENLPNTEPPSNTLRPSLAEGGANIIDLVLKNPTLQGINRLMWLSWNCGQWDSNQEPDNPLNMVGLVESAWRFSGELDMEDVFAGQCEDAITKEYADDIHTAYSIPEQIRKDGIAIIQDIIPQPVEPAPSSETDNLFHDVYLPCWADIPEDSPWKQFTAIEGNQIPDSMLHNPNRITGNDWPLLASENAWISTTLD